MIKGKTSKQLLQGNGFVSELWADLNETKDSAVAVVRKRFPKNVTRVVSEFGLKVPPVLVDYQRLLQRVVDQLTEVKCVQAAGPWVSVIKRGVDFGVSPFVRFTDEFCTTT
jgi:hypothetical protein